MLRIILSPECNVKPDVTPDEFFVHPSKMARVIEDILDRWSESPNDFVVHTWSEGFANHVGYLVSQKRIDPDTVQVELHPGQNISKFSEEGFLTNWKFGYLIESRPEGKSYIKQSEEELVVLNNKGEGNPPVEGFIWNPHTKSWYHDDLGATVMYYADSWLLVMSDGLYEWRVSSAREGMREALLP